MIRWLLAIRNPILPTAALLAVIGVSGAGYGYLNPASRDTAIADLHHEISVGDVPMDDATMSMRGELTVSRTVERAVLQTSQVQATVSSVAQEQAETTAKAVLDKQAADAKAAADRAAAEEAARKAKALADAEAARKAAEEQKAAIMAQAQSNPKAVAKLMLTERGWTESQFGCLDKLWTRESNWRWNADNPSSSAYGIPQALPGSRMAEAGPDWKTNPVTQIKWGLNYIAMRYGSPCSAWGHSQSTGWY